MKEQWDIVVRGTDGFIVAVIGPYASEDECDFAAGEMEESLQAFEVAYECRETAQEGGDHG